MIRHVIYIGSLVVILVIINTDDNEEIDLVVYWALVGLIVEIPLFLYIVNLTKKSFTLKLNYRRIFKYFITSVVIFGLMYVLMDKYLVYNESIFEFLPSVVPFALFGVLFYFGINYVMDRKIKSLVKDVLKELIKK